VCRSGVFEKWVTGFLVDLRTLVCIVRYDNNDLLVLSSLYHGLVHHLQHETRSTMIELLNVQLWFDAG
jgi:hypothetical protein